MESTITVQLAYETPGDGSVLLVVLRGEDIEPDAGTVALPVGLLREFEDAARRYLCLEAEVLAQVEVSRPPVLRAV